MFFWLYCVNGIDYACELTFLFLPAQTILRNGSAVVSPRDFFGALSAALGGSESDLDGYLILETSSAIFDPGSASITLSGLTVGSPSNLLLDSVDWTLNMSTDDLATLFPTDGPTKYNVKVPAEASILHNSSSPHAV